MSRTRRVLLVTVVALTCLLPGSSLPASADHNVTLGHWPTYHWGSSAYTTPVTAFYLIDYTNDSAWSTAIQEVVNEFNAIPEVVASNYRIPYVGYINGGVGTCAFNNDPLGRYSYGTVCKDAGHQTNGGDTHVAGGHFTVNHPYIHLGPVDFPPSQVAEFRRSLFRHELGHMLGLEHSSQCDALMADSAVCPGLTPPRYWTAHDIVALQNFYNPHPYH